MSNLDMRLGYAPDAYADVKGAALVHADPPWSYRNTQEGAAAGAYSTITDQDIAQHLDRAFDAAADDAYLACWCTMPKLGEWFAASSGMRWRYLSAGAWVKSCRLGVGYHWRGDSEILLLYRKGAPKPNNRKMSNAHVGPRERHSMKPVPFLRRVVSTFALGDGPVLDIYAGLSPMAQACRAERRDYIGIECDEARRAEALRLLGCAGDQLWG